MDQELRVVTHAVTPATPTLLNQVGEALSEEDALELRKGLRQSAKDQERLWRHVPPPYMRVVNAARAASRHVQIGKDPRVEGRRSIFVLIDGRLVFHQARKLKLPVEAKALVAAPKSV